MKIGAARGSRWGAPNKSVCLRQLIIISTAAAFGVGAASSASAQWLSGLTSGVTSAVQANDDVRVAHIHTNVEQETELGATHAKSDTPFNIFVDGVPIFGNVKAPAAEDDQRTVDVGLDAMDIQVQFDSDETNAMANVEAIKRSVGYQAGGVHFFPYWNYGAFIERAEVRIMRAASSVSSTPVAILPTEPGKPTIWQTTEEHGDELQYVLRLYGKDGKFDETKPKILRVDQVDRDPSDLDSPLGEALVAYGKNSLAKQNIRITGGAVTVSGAKVPSGHNVFVMGVPVPVSDDGEFVLQEIVPAGSHNVTIAVLDKNQRGLEFQRNLTINKSDWFYIGLADLTVGASRVSGPAELVGATPGYSPDETQVTATGRVAGLVRGKIQGRYLLTALADTSEGELNESFFSNILEKDPRSLLNRIDPDRYYPVYGDDSTAKELAPTQGKFFVKIEDGANHAMWGNFNTNLVGSELARVNRSLYGAKLEYAGLGQTEHGDQRLSVKAYGAQPGTLTQTDEFYGTGGSVYFLKRQDIQIGGEKVYVETRDPITGEVVDRRLLTPDEDYDFDYIQGRVLLTSPLASKAGDTFIVDNGGSDSAYNNVLVINYEYTPSNVVIDGLTYGGRAEAWLGNIAKVGGTFNSDNSDGNDKRIMAVDGTVMLNPGTYVRGEWAQSLGAGDSKFVSGDGGFDLTDQTAAGVASGGANAFRVEAGVDIGEFTSLKGSRIGGYYQRREAGFAGSGRESANEVVDYGVNGSIAVGRFAQVKGQYKVADDLTNATSQTSARGDLSFNIGKRLKAGIGVGYQVATNTAASTKLGGRLAYTQGDYEVYGFGQTDISGNSNATRNARFGVGGKARLSERLSLGGEVSGGDGGIQGRVKSEFHRSDRTKMYLAYETTQRSDAGTSTFGTSTINGFDGNFVVGGKSKLTDALSFYGEERLGHNGRSMASLTHAYGVNYAPTDNWTFGANFERGTNASDVSKTAFGTTMGYTNEGIKVGGALEARFEEDANKDTRTVYLARANLNMKFNPSWRLAAKVNAVVSEANGNFKSGQFYEGSVGFAYRPIDNDRMNALFKYHALYDLPTEEVVNAANEYADYQQRSHILSADMIFDVSKHLSIGAKYGFKFGQVTSARDLEDWHNSTVHLGIVRADWHVVRNWDATVEMRAMRQSQTETTRIGALAGVYRHIGKNLKMGVGYNFADISDDLSNVNAQTQGLFVNAVAKF